MCQKTKATEHVSTPHIPPAKITKSAKDERTDERTDIGFSSLTNGKALRAIIAVLKDVYQLLDIACCIDR